MVRAAEGVTSEMPILGGKVNIIFMVAILRATEHIRNFVMSTT
jgi:hypothetical protein